MKITSIDTFPVFNGARNNLYVTVDTDAGISGVGESGLSGRELAVIGAIEHFKPLLIGQDPSRIEHIWQTLFRGGFFPANRVLCSAISAIDIALWDIQARAFGVPVYRLLGGLARDKVVCYPHTQAPGESDDVQALVANCQRAVAGWCETHAIKLATHNPLGPVSTAACLHLNLASSNVGVQEQPRRPGTTLTDVFPVQVEWQDGYLLPPTRPGLGVEFDREAARRSPFRMTEMPHLRRLDGALTNW